VTPTLLICTGIFGLLFGSFLNVVIVRLPAEDPADRSVNGRSRCPKCGAQIAGYDNIPVLSWLILRGKCRACGEPISARYPLVELLHCGLWGAVMANAAHGTDTVPAAVRAAAPGLLLMSLLVAITFIDLEHRIIPNRLSIPGTVVGLALGIVADPSRWLELLVSALAAGIFLFVTWFIYPKGMGMGDVKMALMMGAYLGTAVVIGLFAGFLLGAVIGVAMIAKNGAAARKNAIPFGPFLAMGTVLAWFWGQDLLDAYLRTIR
jgi:leader peptidase (prepilin peptidase)/N-methyltransferase